VQITLTAEFAAAFPEGVFGALLVRGCPNRPRATALAPRQRELETRLREQFATRAIEDDAVARPYVAYFKRWGQRYPVVHQAKSILAGRPIEGPSALVEAMFTAEVATLVLTSGHDLVALSGALVVDAARDGDRYTRLSGKEQALRPGDMVVRDGDGIIACVIHGPDFRTRLRDGTDAALFGAWCPVGLSPGVVAHHLEELATLIRLEWPAARVDPPLIRSSSG
jgi:DNA/RNA-binding domain of Phe-tRNA-synthetase-like protein